MRNGRTTKRITNFDLDIGPWAVMERAVCLQWIDQMKDRDMSNIVPGFPETIDVPKAQARRLVTALKGQTNLTHAQALEVVAKMHGQQSWGHLRASLDTDKSQARHDANSCADKLPSNSEGEFSYTFQDIMRLKFWDDMPYAGAANAALVRGFKKIAKSRCYKDFEYMPVRLDSDGLRWMCEDVFRSFPTESCCDQQPATVKAIHDAYCELRKSYTRERRDVTYDELDNILKSQPDESIISNLHDIGAALNRRHSILYTNDLEGFAIKLEDMGKQVHDLSLNTDISRLLSVSRLKTQQVSDLRYCAFRSILGQVPDIAVTRDIFVPRRLLRCNHVPVVIVSLQDAVTHGGLDVMLNQARSVGYHVILHWDLVGADPDGTSRDEMIRQARKGSSSRFCYVKKSSYFPEGVADA